MVRWEVISPIDQGKRLPPTRIRQAVMCWCQEAARVCLANSYPAGNERPWGCVGKDHGYPIAKSMLIDRTHSPSDVVYVVDVDFKGHTYRGISMKMSP